LSIRIVFQNQDGNAVAEAEAASGENLLEIAQAKGLALEGTCEGQMACSTCHIFVDAQWFEKLPKASEEEEDMLDLAAGATRYSRLACQILVSETLDGLSVRIPGEHRNMQGR
jgi:ferredoxin-2, mitochondrial